MRHFNKFITEKYDILSNINDNILMSENFAMLYDLLYKQNKNKTLMNNIIDRFLFYCKISQNVKLPCPYLITNEKIYFQSCSQHFLWCSNMFYQHYTITNELCYYNKSKEIFDYVLNNNIFINTNLIINWINDKEYPIKNNNNLFSIKCFTKAGLFAIFDKVDIFDQQLEFIEKNMYLKDDEIYASHYNIETKTCIKDKSVLGNNLELAEGLIDIYNITKNIRYKKIALKIITFCSKKYKNSNYILGILQLYNIKRINDLTIDNELQIKFNEIHKQYIDNKSLPSYSNENNFNVFSSIYIERCLLSVNNISIFGDSHSDIFEKINIENVNFHVNSISGGTLTGLPKRISTLNIQNQIINHIKINAPQFLILKFGQVDIDLGYYYKKIIKEKTINKQDYIKFLINCYDNFIINIQKYINKDKIVIWGINPPSLIDKNDCIKYTSRIIFENIEESLQDTYTEKLNNITEDIKSRTEFSYDFNYELRKYCKDKDIKYVEVFNELLTPEGILNYKFIDKQINDHHLKGVGEHSVKYNLINKLFENYVLKLNYLNKDLTIFSYENKNNLVRPKNFLSINGIYSDYDTPQQNTITEISDRYIYSHYENNGILKEYKLKEYEIDDFHMKIINFDHIFNLEVDDYMKKKLLFHFEFKQGDILLELGSYKCIGSIKISNYIGDEGKIISVEGSSQNHTHAIHNIRCNKITNIIPVNAFVSDSNRKTKLFTCGKEINSVSELLKRDWYEEKDIDVLKVDTILENINIEKITYITLEINLEEYNALLGMKKILIKNDYVRIVCAAWYNLEIREKIKKFLLDLNFKVFIGKYDKLYAIKGKI